MERQLRPLTEETLRAAIRVIGEDCAACAALHEAEQHDGPVAFFTDGEEIFVYKAPIGTADRAPEENALPSLEDALEQIQRLIAKERRDAGSGD